MRTLAERMSRLALALVLLTASGALAGDRFPPQTHIDQGPELVTPSTTADFVFRATVSGRTLPGAEFWCSLDEGEYLPCEQTHRVEGLGIGPHLLLVYAHDPVSGLTDDFPAAWEWMVEEGAPPVDAGSPGGDAGTSDAGVPGDGGTSGGQDAGTEPDAGTELDAGSPGSDAGTSTDAGNPGGSDAGTSTGSDAGTSGQEDAGTSGNPDAGSTPGGNDAGPGDIEDAGSPDGGAPDGGGDVPGDSSPPPEALDYLGGGVGCTGAPAPGAVAGLLLLVLALRRRRR